MSYFNIKIFETNTFFEIKIFQNRYRYFFRYQFFSDTNTDTFFETNTETFSDTKIFSKPIPILLFDTIFFETDTDTIKKTWKSFETKKFRNRNVNLCSSTIRTEKAKISIQIRVYLPSLGLVCVLFR